MADIPRDIYSLLVSYSEPRERYILLRGASRAYRKLFYQRIQVSDAHVSLAEKFCHAELPAPPLKRYIYFF